MNSEHTVNHGQMATAITAELAAIDARITERGAQIATLTTEQAADTVLRRDKAYRVAVLESILTGEPMPLPPGATGKPASAGNGGTRPPETEKALPADWSPSSEQTGLIGKPRGMTDAEVTGLLPDFRAAMTGQMAMRWGVRQFGNWLDTDSGKACLARVRGQSEVKGAETAPPAPPVADTPPADAAPAGKAGKAGK